ncbi:MAG: homocysteine S-methyltransferase family protein [Bryobacteraceae bacterium]|jgi:methionine synthase I (cobalamin-dependent)
MTIIEQLIAGGPVVTDGAWGTQLYARGLDPGDVPDSWNLSHPDRVEEVGRAYVEAGSQVILTNTLRANRVTLAAYGLAEKTVEINRAGAAISRRAAEGRARVFASIGPSGRLLVMGEVTEDELFEAFREQAEALAEGGADALLIETMTDLTEASIAIRAAEETDLPVAASMVFDSGKEKDRTMMGTTPERAAAALESAGADVVGANCGVGIAGYVGVCRRMHAATSLPIWIKANAGLPEFVDGRTTYRMTAAEFASYVPALLEAGASFIGGCCGTGPEFVRAIAQALDGRRTP